MKVLKKYWLGLLHSNKFRNLKKKHKTIEIPPPTDIKRIGEVLNNDSSKNRPLPSNPLLPRGQRLSTSIILCDICNEILVIEHTPCEQLLRMRRSPQNP